MFTEFSQKFDDLPYTTPKRDHIPCASICVSRCISAFKPFHLCLSLWPSASIFDIQTESAYTELKNTTTYSLIPPTTNESNMMRASSHVRGLAGTGILCCLHPEEAFTARSSIALLASARIIHPSPISFSDEARLDFVVI